MDTLTIPEVSACECVLVSLLTMNRPVERSSVFLHSPTNQPHLRSVMKIAFAEVFF